MQGNDLHAGNDLQDKVDRFIRRLAHHAIYLEQTARHFDGPPATDSAHYFRAARDTVLTDYAAALAMLAGAPALDESFVGTERDRWYSAALASAVVYVGVCPDCLTDDCVHSVNSEGATS